MTSEALDGLAVPPADPVGVIVDLLTAAEPGLDRTAARTEASEQVREAAGGDVAGEDDEQVGERPGEGLRSGPAGETTAAAGAGDGRHGERQHHRPVDLDATQPRG